MKSTPNTAFEVRQPLILAAVMAVGMFIGQQLPRYNAHFSYSAGDRQSIKASGSLDEVLRFIESKYVDSIDTDFLHNQAIEQLLAQLDPHSVYISPEELRAVQEDMSGNFEGIGVEFLMLEDTIQVVSPLSGGPSETAGIMAGDKIVTINDTAVAGVGLETGAIYGKLRGPKGTQVRLGVKRGMEAALRQFTVTRDVIPVNSVDIAYMLDQNTGYIKINRFTARTHQEFMEGLTRLVEQENMKNVILDLRGNPGGYLNEATDMLSQLFPEDKLLVYTEGRTEERRDYKSNGRARFDIQHIAVLVDEGSASASEIMAGAIQDHDRGWVVGRRTYGKGLVQEQFPLRNGGALRLTVARYYTPSGRSIQRTYSSREDYEKDPQQRLKNGELSGETSIPVVDSTAYYTGMGRLVYAHGGIMPDVFVPIDTSYMNPYYLSVRQHLSQFAARWMEDRPRTDFPENLTAFRRNWSPDEQTMAALIQYAEQEGVPRNDAQLASCKRELQLQLKARVAKMLFQNEGQYSVLNDDDPAVEKALQLLRDGAPLVKR
jgi:carboxyl-terminal processing protease